MIREARSDDLPRLRAIQAVALAEPWPELLDAGVDGPPICLVCADPDPTGYALAVTDGDGAYLVELAVAAGRRGEGRGSRLLSALVDRLAGRVATVRVTVRVVDERARSFYEERGFATRERLPDRYEAGDGLLLERTL